MFDETPPCADDPTLFFSTDPARKEEAKRVCSTCPFSIPCAKLSEQPIVMPWGIYPVEYGVWAGAEKTPVSINPSMSRKAGTEPSPKQRQQMDRAAKIKALLDDGVTSKVEIGRRVGISHGSVSLIMKNYLQEAK